MGLFPHGYGRGWDEPLAIGRWARFKQRMREPATKNDWAVTYALLVASLLALLALALAAAD